MLCYKYVSVIVKCGISSSLISNSNVMYYASNPINSWQFSWTHDNSVELVAIQLNACQFSWTKQIYKHTELRLITFSKAS